jgi:hypothetical protein
MPYDDPDATDPMTLTGVELVVDEPGAVREMAACFIEEYVRLGLSAEAIAELFECGDFAGPDMAFRQLGPDVIRAMIEEHLDLRGPRGPRTTVDRMPGGALSLPVLER